MMLPPLWPQLTLILPGEEADRKHRTSRFGDKIALLARKPS